MKICPKCKEDNADHLTHCIVCGTKLESCKNQLDAESYIDTIQKKEEQRERRSKIINYMILGVYTVLYILISVFGVINYEKESLPALIPMLIIIFIITFISAYLSLFHPKFLFELRFFMSIDNIEDVEPSLPYYIGSKISGYCILLIGIVFLLKLAGMIAY